jgi:hypothetical protein
VGLGDFIPVVILLSQLSQTVLIGNRWTGSRYLSNLCFSIGDFTFVSGNIIFSNYLNIMYIPNSEMTVFIAAFVGSLIGFLWYNSIRHLFLWVIREV